MPGEQLPKVEVIASPDKVAHFVVYAILSWLVYRAWQSARPALWAVGLSGTYGLLLEVVQYAFFPGRYFEVWDIVANISGAITAVIVLRIINL